MQLMLLVVVTSCVPYEIGAGQCNGATTLHNAVQVQCEMYGKPHLRYSCVQDPSCISRVLLVVLLLVSRTSTVGPQRLFECL